MMRDQLRSLSAALLAVAGAAPTWTTAGFLALLGLAGSASAALVSQWLAPVLVGLSVLLLLRSFYILYVRRRGTRASAAITWLSAVFVVGFWTWRLI
jgi:hypothetical protein